MSVAGTPNIAGYQHSGGTSAMSSDVRAAAPIQASASSTVADSRRLLLSLNKSKSCSTVRTLIYE